MLGEDTSRGKQRGSVLRQHIWGWAGGMGPPWVRLASPRQEYAMEGASIEEKQGREVEKAGREV